MKKTVAYGMALTFMLLFTSVTSGKAVADVQTPGGHAVAASQVPVQTVVWRRGVRGYGPYGGAAARAYYRPYNNGYYGRYRANYGYRPYYGAYYGGY